MKAENITKIRILNNSIIVIYKEGKTEQLKRTMPLMQIIDDILAEGILKYEQVELEDTDVWK